MTIELDKLAVNIRRVCNDDAFADQVLAEIRDSLWLAKLDERLERAETGVRSVLNLHQQQPIPTRHWEQCEEHIPSPENLRRVGGWIQMEKLRSKCENCTYTEHYHCTYDSHDSCGHDDYPCNTARAAQGIEEADDES